MNIEESEVAALSSDEHTVDYGNISSERLIDHALDLDCDILYSDDHTLLLDIDTGQGFPLLPGAIQSSSS